MGSKSKRSSGGAFPAWLPTAVVLGVVFLAVYGWTGQARSEPSSGVSAKAQEVINRYHYAMAHVKKLKEVGKNEMFPLINCPEEFSLGHRSTPGQKVPEFAGNTCEPWIARYAVVFLDKLIDPDMKGLEWSTGSGTMWLLTRLHSLVSIEHHASWVRRVQQTLERIFPKQYIKRWDLYVVEAKDFKTKALEEDYDNFKEYVDAEFLPHEPTYDFVSVDGRARIHCMKRALPLVKPEGGIFMLDNSDREAYVEGYDSVPSHWLKFEDSVNTGERTTIWITCLPGKCGSTTKLAASSSGGKKKGKKTSTA
jgi:hypothetical protein